MAASEGDSQTLASSLRAALVLLEIYLTCGNICNRTPIEGLGEQAGFAIEEPLEPRENPLK